MKMPTGKAIQLGIPPPYAIESAKQEISKKEGIHPLFQQLSFKQRVLEDGHLSDEYCNVQYGSKLDVVVRQGSKYLHFTTHNMIAGNFQGVNFHKFCGLRATDEFLHKILGVLT